MPYQVTCPRCLSIVVACLGPFADQYPHGGAADRWECQWCGFRWTGEELDWVDGEDRRVAQWGPPDGRERRVSSWTQATGRLVGV